MVTSSTPYNSLDDYNKDNYYLSDNTAQQIERFGEGWKYLDTNNQENNNNQDKTAGQGRDTKEQDGGQMSNELYRDLSQGKYNNEQLIQSGVNGKHRSGYDMTFSPHKSFTVAAYSDPQIRETIQSIHREAVKDTLRYVEDNLAQARETKDGATTPTKTGNVVAFTVEHQTSRSGDPQIHTHAVMFNMTKSESGWKALHSDAFKSDLAEKIYENQLAYHAKERGLATDYVNSDSGKSQYTTVAGVPDGAVKANSMRAQAIDSYLENHRDEMEREFPNATEGELKQISAIRTRPEKTSMSAEDIENRFKKNLQEAGVTKADIVTGIEKAKEAKANNMQQYKMNAEEIASKSIDAITANESVFGEGKLMKTAMEISRGDVSCNEIKNKIEEFKHNSELVSFGAHTINDGKRHFSDSLFTSREILQSESNSIDRLKQGKGNGQAIMSEEEASKAISLWEQSHHVSLTSSQRETVSFMLSNNDKYNAVQGYAGTGKTTVMTAVKDIAEGKGWNVTGVSETNTAVQEMQEAGVKDSKTVTKFIEQNGEGVGKNTLVLADESSFIGSKNFDKITSIAEQNGARLSFWGDKDQLPSVAAGKTFEYAMANGHMNYVENNEIKRQTDSQYLSAVKDIIEKKVEQSIEKLTVVEGDSKDLVDKVASDYVKNGTDKGIIVAGTNKEKDEINKAVKEKLGSEGKDTNVFVNKNLTDVQKLDIKNYARGDILSAQKTGGGFRAGTEVIVTGVDMQNGTLHVSHRGEDKTIDVRRDGDKFESYEAKKIQVAPGDKVIFTKNNHKEGITNSKIAHVKSVNKDGSITFDIKGKEVTSQSKFFDHGHAVTDYRAQGKTTQSVFVYETRGFQNYYVAASRGREKATIYTKDKVKFLKSARRVTVKTTSMKHVENINKSISNLETELEQHMGERSDRENALKELHELVETRNAINQVRHPSDKFNLSNDNQNSSDKQVTTSILTEKSSSSNKRETIPMGKDGPRTIGRGRTKIVDGKGTIGIQHYDSITDTTTTRGKVFAGKNKGDRFKSKSSKTFSAFGTTWRKGTLVNSNGKGQVSITKWKGYTEKNWRTFDTKERLVVMKSERKVVDVAATKDKLESVVTNSPDKRQVGYAKDAIKNLEKLEKRLDAKYYKKAVTSIGKLDKEREQNRERVTASYEFNTPEQGKSREHKENTREYGKAHEQEKTTLQKEKFDLDKNKSNDHKSEKIISLLTQRDRLAEKTIEKGNSNFESFHKWSNSRDGQNTRNNLINLNRDLGQRSSEQNNTREYGKAHEQEKTTLQKEKFDLSTFHNKGKSQANDQGKTNDRDQSNRKDRGGNNKSSGKSQNQGGGKGR